MKRKQFESIPPEYEGHQVKGKYDYSIGAFVRNEILAVDFYENRSGIWRAMWRTLISGNDFCNYNYKNKLWSAEQLDTIGSKCMSLNVYRARSAWDGHKIHTGAKKAIDDFVRQLGRYVGRYDIWDTLRYAEQEIAEEKRQTAEERRHIRIQKKMALAPQVPDDFENFIREKLFGHDHIMYVSREKAVCSRCGKEVKRAGGMKHNTEGNCPLCGKKVIYKAIGRMKEHEIKKEVLLIQKWENDVILRYFKCSLYSENGKKENLQYSESIRTYHDKQIECFSKRYINYVGFCGEKFWSDKMNAHHQVSYGRCCLYDGNLQEIMDLLGEGKYLPVREMAEEGTVAPWKNILGLRPDHARNFEKLYKAGLRKLAVEYINTWDVDIDGTQRELKKLLMITGPMLDYMRANNSGKKVLEVLQDAKKNNHGLNDQEIFELAAAGIKASELEKVSEKRKIIKTLHYLKKVKGYPNLKTKYRHYVDYMNMIQAMEYDLGKDTARYPGDLRAAHDKAVEAFNETKNDRRKKEANKNYPQIRERKKELDEKYGYRDKEYMIIAPADAGDIIEEGRMLHHCVGGDYYLKKHNEGYTFIFFIRRIREPEERYCTIELDPKDNRIVQWYGYNDRKTDEEQVNKVLDQWKRQLKRKEEPENMQAG